MKIAHVVATFPPHIGGMGQVALDECKKLPERGNEVTVFTLRYPGFKYDDKQWPFKVVRLRPIFKLGDAGWTPQLVKYLKGFDVVHLHYPFYGGAEWVLLAKIFNKQKYVVTYHMDAVTAGWAKQLVQKVYDALFSKVILRESAKIFTVSEEHFKSSRFGKYLSRERLRRHGVGVPTEASGVVNLPNGVNTEIFKPRTTMKAEVGLGEWEKKKIILFVGNLLPVKGFPILLRALSLIPGDEVVGLIVGGGYEEERYRKLTRDLGLAGRVRFVGACTDQQELARYYSIAHCVVAPSLVESFSLVVVESMASGVPIVGSDIAGIHEKISACLAEDGESRRAGRDGFLFTSGSAENLKEQLEKVLNMSAEERKEMGERGRQKAVEKYDLERHVNKLEEVYKSLTVSV